MSLSDRQLCHSSIRSSLVNCLSLDMLMDLDHRMPAPIHSTFFGLYPASLPTVGHRSLSPITLSARSFGFALFRHDAVW